MRMTSPLLVAAIAFWGWQTGHWAWAAGMALALGASFHVDARWDFPLKVQYRAADVSYLLAFAEGAFFFFTEGNPQGLVSFFAWLPVAHASPWLDWAFETVVSELAAA